MTHQFQNVYIDSYSTVCGPYEADGPLRKNFDKIHQDLYCGEDSWEQAEVHYLEDSLKLLLKKASLEKDDIEMVISGDLMNQITASCYASLFLNAPFLGIYSACATSVEGILVGSTFLENGTINNCITACSSHNLSSEKQFRNPTEYGAPKPKTATFTATGGASLLLTRKKTKIKVESGTVGKMVDFDQTDPLHMGAVMAPAAADTIYQHLQDLKRSPSDYDLILTGDLGLYGREILKEYMQKTYEIDLSQNYNDCGCLLYDYEKQKEVNAGGSGPVCSALVNYSTILKGLEDGTYKRVLLVATGALFSPTTVFQKDHILSIAHAVSLEATK